MLDLHRRTLTPLHMHASTIQLHPLSNCIHSPHACAVYQYRHSDTPPQVKWIKPGSQAAAAALASFLQPSRLKHYDSKRNDPTVPNVLSGLSPYLHYGQLAPQRAAIAAAKCKSVNKGAVESFLEELIVRRELSDNYCHYEPNYDNLRGAAQWAQDTLAVHATDKREHVYTRYCAWVSVSRRA